MATSVRLSFSALVKERARAQCTADALQARCTELSAELASSLQALEAARLESGLLRVQCQEGMQRAAKLQAEVEAARVASTEADKLAITTLTQEVASLRIVTPPGDCESVGGRFAVPLSNLI